MSESIVISIALPASHATVSDWRAQLIDETGANVGSPVSTGFVHVGSGGFYQWFYDAMPDDFQGGVQFYSNADPTTTLGLISVNPLQATVFPSGANEVTFTVRNSVTNLPIDGATVWISTDLAGTNVIWSGATDAFGEARNINGEKPFLNNGTYYGWVQDSGYTDTNPTTLNVSP